MTICPECNRTTGIFDYYSRVTSKKLCDDCAAKRLLKLNSFEGCGPDAATRKKMIKAEQVKANKFYVGSKTALDKNWGHSKVEKAIEHAKKLVEKTGEDQFIVQIIHVVERKAQPVVVRKVGR